MTTSQPMGFVPASVATDPGFSDEDLARADTYGLLAEWFIRQPSDDLFNRLAGSPAVDAADQTDLANAWRDLIATVAATAPADAAAEFQNLFVAVGKPLVALHASVYVGGAMNQPILVDLRNDLAAMGLESNPDLGETEDHFSTLCEIMRYLIAAPDAKGSTLPQQQHFFSTYLQPWMDSFFDALQDQPQAKVYGAVGGFARAFFAIERQAFDIFSASLDAVDNA
jgi:TorA maturation chaperone TorD